MFKRKLKALGYHHPEDFNIHDEQEFRSCIIWLENQKIRLYKVEDRGSLADIESEMWQAAYENYLKDLRCPVDRDEKSHAINWLLSHAVRLEYNENSTDFNAKHSERQNRKNVSGNGAADSHSLSDITGDNPDLKAGIASISKLLNIPQHHDHVTLLQAIGSLVEQRLSEDGIISFKKSSEKRSKVKQGDHLLLDDVTLGFNTNDSAVNEAAKILRLLHIHELRALQTRINQAIVSVQKSTADPKTDQSLGKVGR
eukprot:gene20075-22045_t